jgi:uncharacterized protein (TIGR02646 family)
MIALTRRSLPTQAHDYLVQRTAEIQLTEGESRDARAKTLWKNKAHERMTEVRRTLRDMSSGNERCMYCEESAGTDIDHFCPRSTEPLLTFAWSNYLLACSACNSNFKRDEFPCDPTGEPYLIDPTLEDPATLLTFSPSTGRYEPVPGSLKASESLRVFGINRPLLETARRDAWRLFQLAIVAYDTAMAKHDIEQAERFAQIVRRQPLAGVLNALVTSIDDADLDLVSAECRSALSGRPEIRSWLTQEPA